MAHQPQKTYSILVASLTLNIRNYRAIPYRKPLEFEIGKGITFFLGPNNVGKSSLIKIFFELREAFSVLSLKMSRRPPYRCRISLTSFLIKAPKNEPLKFAHQKAAATFKFKLSRKEIRPTN